MIKFGIGAIATLGPGIENWAQLQAMLNGEQPFDLAAPLPKLAPSLLPANERRRTTTLIKLALQCGADALAQRPEQLERCATVFASSGGDLEIVDRILSALQLEGKPVSPIHFHNSVHNAPAGYWSIAAASRAASTSLSAYDSSFGAGLLEAATQVLTEQQPVLLVAYDLPAPEALHRFRPLSAPFAVALLLQPAGSGSDQGMAELTLELADPASTPMPTAISDPALEALRSGNPAARALPLLALLAKQGHGKVALPYLDGALQIEIHTC